MAILLPSEIKTALKLSFGFWILGVMLATPFLFLKFGLLAGIRMFLLVGPIAVFLLARIYLWKSNPKDSTKEGLRFGLFLVMTHLPLDALFIFLFFKEGLILFKAPYLGTLFYSEMILFSLIAGVSRKRK